MTGWALIAAALLAQPFLNDQKPPPPSLLSLEWRHRPDSNRGMRDLQSLTHISFLRGER